MVDERHERAGDEQEQAEVEGDGGDQLERADRGRRPRPGAGTCVNGGSPSEHRDEADRERDQQPAGGDAGRVAQDRQACAPSRSRPSVT